MFMVHEWQNCWQANEFILRNYWYTLTCCLVSGFRPFLCCLQVVHEKKREICDDITSKTKANNACHGITEYKFQ